MDGISGPRCLHGLKTRVTGGLAAILAIALLGGGCGAPAPASKFVEQADRLHREALTSAVVSDADLRDYVQLVGKRLADAAREADPNRTRDPMFSSLEFHLVACDVPNVVTTGGRHLYVFGGLFSNCRSEDELAAAMAHALAHAVNLDVEHIDLRPDPQTPLPLVAWDMATHRYTIDQERTADRAGYEIYLRAGYDAKKFTTVLERLADRYPGLQAPDRKPALVRIQDDHALGVPVEGPANRPLPVADPKTFESLRNQAGSAKQVQPPPLADLIFRAMPNCMLSGDTPEQEAARQQLRPLPPAKRLEPS
jgi:hypothetical protein